MSPANLRRAATAKASEHQTSSKTNIRIPKLLVVFFLAMLGLSGSSLAIGGGNTPIQSHGTISYPTDDSNLAVIPRDWGLTYGSGPQIIFLDYNVVRAAGEPSIRLEAHTSNDVNVNRECDGTWYAVRPGDHIIARCWIKTSPSSLGDSDYRHGGRIGIDCYAHTSVGYGIVESACEVPGGPATGNIPGGDCVHNWNNPIWTQKGWDIIIPTAQYTKVSHGGTIQNCDPVQIDSMVLWLDVRPVADAGLVWFSSAELYINP